MHGVEMLVKFDVYNDGEMWCAKGVGEDIFTQGKTLDELQENMREAVEAHFGDVLEKGEEIRVISVSEFEVGPRAKAAGG